MEEIQVITDIEQLTPEWLTNTFKRNGYLSKGKIINVELRESKLSTGFHLHFFDLSFSEDAQRDAVSSSIVVKTPQEDHRTLKENAEIEFYNLVVKAVKNEAIPFCYDAVFDEKSRQSHIILEDLSETHNEYSFSEWWPVAPLKNYIESAIVCLAEFHASVWDHKKLEEFTMKSFLRRIKNKHQSLNQMLSYYGDRISNKRRKIFETVFSKFPELAYERYEKGNLTIIHGDSHFCNFMYPKDIKKKEHKTKLMDWEDWEIGIGTIDLAYMIGFYWLPERSILKEKDLVKKYHKTLLDFDVKNYSWEDCWKDYRFSLYMNLFRVVDWWKNGMHNSIVMMGLENSFPILEEVKSMEFLEN